MEKFEIQKKGYDKSQVDNYIKSLICQYEKTLFEQKDRIEELKSANATLECKIAEYESRQDNINLALTQAIEKAKNIEYASKVRYALEGERIKLFESKWTNYCKTFINKISGKESAILSQYLKQTREELALLVSTELNISDDVTDSDIGDDFIEESTRLNGLS